MGDGEDGVMLRSRGVRRRPDNFERKGKKERADEEKHEEGEHDVEKERGELENLVVCSGGILFWGVRRRPDNTGGMRRSATTRRQHRWHAEECDADHATPIHAPPTPILSRPPK